MLANAKEAACFWLTAWKSTCAPFHKCVAWITQRRWLLSPWDKKTKHTPVHLCDHFVFSNTFFLYSFFSPASLSITKFLCHIYDLFPFQDLAWPIPRPASHFRSTDAIQRLTCRCHRRPRWGHRPAPHTESQTSLHVWSEQLPGAAHKKSHITQRVNGWTIRLKPQPGGQTWWFHPDSHACILLCLITHLH